MTRQAADPVPEVASRLERWRRDAGRADRLQARLATARLASFAVGMAITIWVLRSHPGWWYALVPVALGFTALVLWHGKARWRAARAARAVGFYEDAEARLLDRWIGRGPTGDAWRPVGHPYADDLDLFGNGSLFQLLATTRTSLGARTLARWLCEPVPADEARARQAAVSELLPRVDLREELALIGDPAHGALAPTELEAWATGAPVLTAAWPLRAARCLALAAVAASAAWLLDLGLWPLTLVVALELLLGQVVGRRLDGVVHAASSAGKALAVLADLLAFIERGRLQSPRLVSLARDLDVDGLPPSARLAALARHLDALADARGNPFFVPVAFLLQTRLRRAWALDAWRAEHGARVPTWLAVAGEFETLMALSLFAWEHPETTFPELVDTGPCLAAEAIGHVFLPDARCVRNDVLLDTDHALLLISGSNMSGKSTLLRAVGVGVVLALAGAPVRARCLRMSALALGASIRIQDSLQEGASHFYAEITKLATVAALADGELPLLFLLDEILHGTNSSDRLAGSSAVVTRLVERGAVGLVTTHDLALAAIADDLAPRARNVHFEDSLEDGRMTFDYRMRDGVVTRGNALQLMRSLGLPV